MICPMIWTCIEILDCRLCLNFKKFSKTTDHKISCKDMGSQEGRSSFAKYGEKECNAMKRSLYFATAKPKRYGTIIFVTIFYFVKCELYPIRL